MVRLSSLLMYSLLSFPITCWLQEGQGERSGIRLDADCGPEVSYSFWMEVELWILAELWFLSGSLLVERFARISESLSYCQDRQSESDNITFDSLKKTLCVPLKMTVLSSCLSMDFGWWLNKGGGLLITHSFWKCVSRWMGSMLFYQDGIYFQYKQPFQST